jgi:hypothetical protein
VSSSASSDDPLVLDRIAEDIPTTPEDVAALRRARERSRRGFSLEQVELLEPPDWLPAPPRRRTFEGREPFEL